MKSIGQKFKVSAPGRICLFGEHQDYLQLPVIAAAISERIYIEGKLRNDYKIVVDLPDISEKKEFQLNFPLNYTEERDYFKSSLNVLYKHGIRLSNGIDSVVKGSIPINAGASSSSALVVAWVHLLSQLSDSDIILSPEEIGKYAHEAEVIEFNEPGGMMDEITSAIGGLLRLDFYPSLNISKIDSQLKSFILADSGEPKNTKYVLSHVKERILKVVKQLADKNSEFSLQTLKYNDIESFSNDLIEEDLELLKGTIKNRDITNYAEKVLSADVLDHKLFGDLLNEHQGILRNVLGISTDKIDLMIKIAIKKGAYGAKINGSGGGGTMFAYVPENTTNILEELKKISVRAFIINIGKGTKIEF